MKYTAVLAVAVCCLLACGQRNVSLHAGRTGHLLVLDSGWTFQQGGQRTPTDSSYGQVSRTAVRPTEDVFEFLRKYPAPQYGWLHASFKLPADWPAANYALTVLQSVASEIYLDSALIASYGRIDPLGKETREYDPLLTPIPVSLRPGEQHTLDVRISLAPGTRYTTIFESPNPLFRAEIKPIADALAEYTHMHVIETGFLRLNIGINIMLFIIHFFFFILNRGQVANLFLSLSGIVYVIAYILQLNYFLYTPNHTDRFFLGNFVFFLFQLGNSLLFLAVHHFLDRKRDLIYWLLLACFFIALVLNVTWYGKGWQMGGASYQILTSLCILIISLRAAINRKKGAKMFVAGSVLSAICFIIFAIGGTFSADAHFLRELELGRYLWFMFFWLSIVASISAYLAWDFSMTSEALKRNLQEVKILSSRNVLIEKEKQALLASQNQELERKVAERTEALNQSLEDLKSTQQQLIQSEKMASLGELTAGIAHEIQNPLNFVNNFSEVNADLTQELQDAAARGDFKEVNAIANDIRSNQLKISEHGKRADGIVKSMLQHSRSSGGVKEPTDVNKLVDEYVHLAYHGYRARQKDFNVKLELDLDPAAGKVEMVAQDIGRVILNLLNNAFYAVQEKAKAAGQGYAPTVWTRTGRSHVITEMPHSESGIRTLESVIIEVADNGPGIPDHVKAKIFQPFFTTKPTGQGTGLGLSLSYDIVTKGNGGILKAVSIEGEGTTITIILPTESVSSTL